MIEAVLKRFEEPDEITHFEKGVFETVTLGGMTIGRATYEPGWKWSEHVGKELGQLHCTVEHVGMVISGCATAAFGDRRDVDLGRPKGRACRRRRKASAGTGGEPA